MLNLPFHSLAIQIHHVAGSMAILVNFGLGELAGGFRGPGGVDLPWNLLALEPNLQDLFNRLELWFERTEVCHSETSESH